MTMLDMDLSPELHTRLRRDCEDGGRQPDSDWAELIEVVTEIAQVVKVEQETGTSVTDVRLAELARQWRALIEHFTGGEQPLPYVIARL
jgi:hypothetical protein